jgi:acyl-coenzyme A thioesterase PaaI-like protein
MRCLAFRSFGLNRARLSLRWAYAAAFTEQNGFVHAGIVTAALDNACDIAAFR